MPARTHGLTGTPEYFAWQNMIRRCHQPKTASYKYYGERGIRVCDRWRNFANFIHDMGLKPFLSAQIDRKDNSGDYEPGNCRWVDLITQGSNRRNNCFIDINGEVATISEWARRVGVDPRRIFSRIVRGWDPVLAVIAKPQTNRRKPMANQYIGEIGELPNKAWMQNNKQPNKERIEK